MQTTDDHAVPKRETRIPPTNGVHVELRLEN